MNVAYPETYLDDAMKNLGEAFDYGVNDCHMDPDALMDLLISTGIADALGGGDPKYLVGLSGTELVMEAAGSSRSSIRTPKPSPTYERSPEYWTGWSLAYYQWTSGKSFKTIHDAITMKQIVMMYRPLHEAPLEKYVETMNAFLRRKS